MGIENAFVNDKQFFQQESFEGVMDSKNIEIGIANKDGFKRLKPSEVADYLASIA